MRHILSVQDLSCVGRCSLTAALPVLSAMGHQCSVLPTAVLSTHTGFPNPKIVDLTSSLGDIIHHWSAMELSFQGISVGYLSSPVQIEFVRYLHEAFPCPLILDPVLGDWGKLYAGITRSQVQSLRRLLPRADVILPNCTEAAYLTKQPYPEVPDLDACAVLAQKLLEMGTQAVVLTGVTPNPSEIGWYYTDGRTCGHEFLPKIPLNCHGTGDLFSAVFTGAYLSGASIPDSAGYAARFVGKCLENTPFASPMGVCFEPVLPWLWEHSISQDQRSIDKSATAK